MLALAAPALAILPQFVVWGVAVAVVTRYGRLRPTELEQPVASRTKAAPAEDGLRGRPNNALGGCWARCDDTSGRSEAGVRWPSGADWQRIRVGNVAASDVRSGFARLGYRNAGSAARRVARYGGRRPLLAGREAAPPSFVAVEAPRLAPFSRSSSCPDTYPPPADEGRDAGENVEGGRWGGGNPPPLGGGFEPTGLGRGLSYP